MELQSRKDIRGSQRHPFDGAVQVSWQNRSGETRMVRAKCLDLSEHGVSFLCEQEIEARTRVYLQAAAYGLMGNATVRYCRRTGLRHKIGLMFTAAMSQADEGRKRCVTDDPMGAEKQ